MRQLYGADAVVVNTSEVREGGLFGFFGKRLVELTASVHEFNTPPRRASGKTPSSRSAVERRYTTHSVLPDRDTGTTIKAEPASTSRTGTDTIRYFEQIVRDAQQRMNQSASTKPEATGVNELSGAQAASAPVISFPERTPKESVDAASLRKEVQEMRDMLRVLYTEQPETGLPPEFADFYRQLVERGITRKIAATLVGSVAQNGDLAILRDARVFKERLHMEIRRMTTVTNGLTLSAGRCRVVALCGATGVGKTTNLAKLAAHYALKERVRVALLTADTYRIAASDQLRVYANIIGLPMRIANDMHEMQEAVQAFKDYDMVFLDTAGGSQFNLEQINELKTMLQVAKPDDVLLVLSANTQIEDLRNVMTNFRCLNPTSLLFTKLDETRRYGTFFTMLVESGLPLSYLSTGQNVPDDIRQATPGGVAGLVLEGRWNRG